MLMHHHPARHVLPSPLTAESPPDPERREDWVAGAPSATLLALDASPAARERVQRYEQLRRERTQQWMAEVRERHRLQALALAALPQHLREKASQPDLTPYPPARNVLFDAPPAAYLEPEPQDGGAQGAAAGGGKAQQQQAKDAGGGRSGAVATKAAGSS